MKLAAPWNSKNLNYALLAAILALALYLRLDNLGSVQRFWGDQSRDYLFIMKWKQDGVWPMLGPFRMVGQDYAIGPGWFYTIAPALWLTNFNPIAGAATIAVVSVIAVFLYWWWIMQTTGSALAALATAAVFAFSPKWIANERQVWNPQMLPFAVAAMTCLIVGLERRPVSCLALFLMLVAILPHWHSTGIPVILAALIPAAWALWRGRARWREASLIRRIAWGVTLAAVLIALYLPPILYEMRPGRSNLRHYIQNTFLAAPHEAQPLPARMADAAGHLVRLVSQQAFFLQGLADTAAHRPGLRGANGLGVSLCLWTDVV